jgi:hypothetical protein
VVAALATSLLGECLQRVRFGLPSCFCRWPLGATGVPQVADPIADKASDLFYREGVDAKTARNGLPPTDAHGLTA